MRCLAVACVSLSLVVACAPPTESFSEADEAAIRALVAPFDEAVLAGDWAAFVVMFTEDAVLMPPNAPVLPMKDFLAWIEPMGYTALEHRIEFLDIDGRGDLAYARGTYAERFTVAGVADPIEDSGKVLGVLRKQADGNWLVSVWASSSDLPVGQ